MEMKVMSNMLRHITHCQFTVLAYLHTQHFTRKWNEPYLSAFPAAAGTHLPTRTRRDGRLSRPWCTAKPRPRFEPTPSCRHYRTPNSVLAFITAHPRQRQSDTPIPIPKHYGIGDDFPGEINRTRPTSAVTSPCIVYIHNKLCGRPPQYAPAPVTLTFDLLTLKVVSESRACDVGYLCANFSFNWPLYSRLRPDRCQTASSLNDPAARLGGRGITMF